MELRALSLRIGQEELNGWIARWLNHKGEVRGVRVEITPTTILLRGEYLLNRFGFAWVKFEAQVDAEAQGRFVAVRLADLKVVSLFGRLPIGSFRKQVVNRLADAQPEWLRIEEETLILDVEHLLRLKGIDLKANLRGIHRENGALTLEAQAPEAPSV